MRAVHIRNGAYVIRKIREIRALRDRVSARRKEGLFIAEGERLVAEIPAEDIDSLYASESYISSHHGADVDQVLPDDVYKKLSDTVHPQGILAVVKMRMYDPEELPDGDLYMILESIQDPGNLGTIIRTAEAAGVTAVIMNKGCADVYSPKTVRSTMGSLFRVPFLYAEGIKEAVEIVKQKGATVYAADLGGKLLSDADIKGKRAFIIGNEGNGISEEAGELADEKICIPMKGKVESLNAAVSAAILMYWRQR